MWKKYLIVFWDLDENGSEYERTVAFDNADKLLYFISELDFSLVEDYSVYEYLYQGRVLSK